MDFSQQKDEEIALQLQVAATSVQPDNRLVQSIYEEIYKRYYKQSFYLTRYYGLSHNDAEDVLQEVFVILFKSIHTYHAGKPFKPWFFTIILNKVRKKYNELKKRRYTELDDIQEISSTEEKNKFEKLHFSEYLKDITLKIPNKLSEVLLLKVNTDLNMDEIADTIGISRRQVYNRLDEAYQLIRKLMEEETS